MTSFVVKPPIDQQFNHPRLRAFVQRFGQGHLELATHAAFPLALTPELLYLLRENFQPQAPWIAVADILLSLCDPVGHQLYELEREIRHELLLVLKNSFGEQRLYQLSDFMVLYIRQHLQTDENVERDLGAAPHWTALAYIRPGEAVNDIAQELKKALSQENPAEWVYLTSVLESYGGFDPLIKAGFEPLLTLARGWEAKARGETEIATTEFGKLGHSGEQVEVGGVKFTIPSVDEGNQFSFQTLTVNRRGEIINRETKQARYFSENLGNGITLEMVAIPGGTFLMGASENEKGSSSSELPQHQVTVPPFFMGKYPVTQAQWRAIASLEDLKVERDLDPNPAYFKDSKDLDLLPVEQVSWNDAVEFCQRLSKHTGREYKLPSEAQWEYACRAGTSTPFYFGETITGELANYDASSTYAEEPKGEYRRKTTPVGTFPPNAFGLYDMHGNVFEWCADDWHGNYEGAPTDGSAWVEDDGEDNDNRYQVIRGGCWPYIPYFCRSAYRYDPDIGRVGIGDDIGFRVVCVAART